MGMKQKVKNYLRKKIMNLLSKDIYELKFRLDADEQNLRSNNTRLDAAEQNLRSNNTRFDAAEQNLKLNNDKLTAFNQNLRNNNELLARSNDTTEMLSAKFSVLKNKFLQLKTADKETVAEESSADNVQENDNPYDFIDYFDFENHFRGSRELIKQRQTQYLKYFKNCKNVIDLGSGRGEFLELLGENGINATGIELYDEFVELCKNRHLNVIQADAVGYLSNKNDIDGIFAGQLVEHLTMAQIINICKTAFNCMKKGSYMILETPNPMSLAIFTNSFYIDPSHKKPVHPFTLKYIVEKIGFSEVEILFTENSKDSISIPAIKSDSIKELEEFNKAMQVVSNRLFGSQDYSIIARK